MTKITTNKSKLEKLNKMIEKHKKKGLQDTITGYRQLVKLIKKLKL